MISGKESAISVLFMVNNPTITMLANKMLKIQKERVIIYFGLQARAPC